MGPGAPSSSSIKIVVVRRRHVGLHRPQSFVHEMVNKGVSEWPVESLDEGQGPEQRQRVRVSVRTSVPRTSAGHPISTVGC